ncbi:MAG: peptidylprolyl isomerase [Coriobacteriia bacterium]
MKPQAGETVRVHYRGTLADGSEFDSSAGRDPLEFTLGDDMVIPGFESAVGDLAVGESATVTLGVEDAYGPRNDAAFQQVPLEAFGEMTPVPGLIVGLEGPNGEQAAAAIAEVGDESVTLDFNHPLAGQELTFELTLVEILGR